MYCENKERINNCKQCDAHADVLLILVYWFFVNSHCYSRSHSDTPHSEGLLWTSDQPDAETAT